MDNSLEQRIQCLEDIEAIKKLQATYGHFVDQGWNGKVFQDVSNVFTEDATFECAAFNLNAIGNNAISETLKQGSVFAIAQHSFTNPIIDVTGDTATGKWLLWVGVNGGEANIVFESEDVKYTRTSEGWKIQSIELFVAQMLKNPQA
jgi:ketosteroid isomerase-like protein